MKTLDIQAKEWFDKVNGNSYFSAIVTIDYGLETEKQVYVPFQYGYGNSYITETIHQLQTEGLLPKETIYNLNTWCKDNNIILRSSLRDKCLKREVINWGSN